MTPHLKNLTGTLRFSTTQLSAFCFCVTRTTGDPVYAHGTSSFSTYRNTFQIWSGCTRFTSCALNRYTVSREMRNFTRWGENGGFPLFSCNKLRYCGHFDFYFCERHYGMLRGQINTYLPPGHPIIAIRNNRIKMVAVSAKRSMAPSANYQVIFRAVPQDNC